MSAIVDYFRKMAPIWKSAGARGIYVSPEVEKELLAAGILKPGTQDPIDQRYPLPEEPD